MAWYRVGTVNVTNNSSTVVGVGTVWVQAAAIGETFLGPDGGLYEITAINSNTSLSINPAYKGPTSTAQNYALMPTEGYNRDTAFRVAALVNAYASVKDNAGQGKFAAGTVAAPSLRGTADEDTGVNFEGGNVLGLVAGGAKKATVNSTGVEVHGKMKAATAEITGNQATAGTNTHSGLQRITNTTASTSPTTGAETIAGGLGVGGAIHTGSTPSWLSPDSQTAPMVFIKDTYRQQVEAASGGRQTVLYTVKGQPSIMNIIPVFNLEDIDPALGTGVHPAFIVGGVQKSELFIGTHIGPVSENELISQPGVEPAHSRNHDQFVTLARACGAGWHVMTNAEWSAIALWSHKNGTMPRGNTNYGRSSDAPHETARRMDLLEPGNTGGNPRTRTGSGPASWRHDHTMHGISDLCGNVWEWTPGMRIVNGEIQVIANNDAALSATDLAAGSTAWRAIDGATGELVAPGHANAVKYAASGTAAYTLARASGQSFEGMTNPGSTPVSSAALQKLKSLGLFPVANTGLGGDGFWHNLTDERLLIRGGNWDLGAAAGVFALSLGTLRSYSAASIGARPAFVL